MAVSGIRGVINETFVRRFQGLASGSSGNSLSSALNGGSSENSISAGLRFGAQTFATSVQALNGLVSYLNVSRANLEQLDGVTDKLIVLAERASKSGISSDAREQLNLDFERLANQFQSLVENATFGERETLDLDTISETFVNLGLDPSASRSIAEVFEQFRTPSDDNNLASEEVKGHRPYFVPSAAYVTPNGRQLARTTVEYEEIFDGTLDITTRPNAFRMVNDLKGMKEQLTDNIAAIDNAVSVVGKNIDLVRAAGFAFLDLSETISSEAEADEVADQLRDRIRKDARGALSQSENLEGIVVASLAFDLDALTGES